MSQHRIAQPPHAAGNPDRSAQRGITLVVVRHGQADNNAEQRFGGWSDVPLTAHGRDQAQAAAQALSTLRPARIISSDLRRAAETAQAIAAATGCALEYDRNLRERSVGELDGMSFADAEARYPELVAALRRRDPTVAPPGGERTLDVYARIEAALDHAIAPVRDGQTVVLVSHGIAIFNLLALLTGMGPLRPETPLFALVDNASISRLSVQGSKPGARQARLLSWNQTAHLSPPRSPPRPPPRPTPQ